MNNIKNFIYLILINNNKIILKHKLTKAIYKTTLNKILKINNIINRVLKQFIYIVSKQIQFLFNKYI